MKRRGYSKIQFAKQILIVIGIVLCASGLAQTPIIDSLNSFLRSAKEDTSKVNALGQLSNAYVFLDVNKAEDFLNKGYSLALKLNYKKGMATNLLALGRLSARTGNYAKASSLCDSALQIWQQLNNKEGISDCLYKKGEVESMRGLYPIALDYLQKSLAIRKELKDKVREGDCYNGIGGVYLAMGNYDVSLTNFMQAVALYEKAGSGDRAFMMLNNIGAVYSKMEEYTKALEYYMQGLNNPNKIHVANAYVNIAGIYLIKDMPDKAIENFFIALKFYNELDHKNGIAITMMNLGECYIYTKDFKKAQEYNLKALKLSEEIGDMERICDITSNIGRVYYEQNDFQKAQEYVEKALLQAKEIGLNARVKSCYLELSKVYISLNDYKKALESYQQYAAVKDTMFNIEKASSIAELQTKYETDKKEKEIQLLTKDNQLKEKAAKEQQIIRYSLGGGLGLLLILSLVLYNRYRFKQNANSLLEIQKQEIEQKNMQITDSIDYAKTIQEAILPSVKTVEALFPESFILYKPKAIVSGDFYWVGQADSKVICAVADCTGHGVPGAFMSMLGNNILENVIKRNKSSQPAYILDSLNEEVIDLMAKDKERATVKNGMDIALVAIDKAANKLEYAGAHNSLYLVRDGILSEIKADKFSIGSLNKGEAIHFTNHSIDLKKEDVVYLFSDGYADQIGGPDRKKFYYQTFKDLLLSVSVLDMNEQKKRLDETITDWKANFEQTDDILVVGIKC